MAEVLARTSRAIPPVLREDVVFRWFFSAHSISLVGDQISMLAIPLVAVLVLDADAAQMGFLGAAGLVPSLLFALHAGAWVDRRGRRRRLMIAADLWRAALLVTIPLAWALDVLTLAQLYGVAFGVGTMSVVFAVCDSALFVSIVPRERYMEANSLVHGSRAFSYVAGPPIAGAIVQVASAPIALIVDAFSFLGSAFCLGRIDPTEPPTDTSESGHVTAGLRYILRSAVVRSALAATAWINLFNFMFWAIFVLFATRELDVGPGLLGAVLGAGAIGGLFGSVVAGRIGRRIGVGPAFVAGCVLFPLPLVLVPLAGGPEPLVLACLFLAEFGSGVGVMILDITAGSIFAAVIPHELRSRVTGAYMLVNYGVRPVGALLGGALGAAIGLRPTLWIATVGALAGVLFMVGSPIMQMHELPETAE